MIDLDVNEQLWRDLLSAAHNDQGEAAQEHFAAGHPVYYTEDDTPADLLIKEYPDGRRELIRFAVYNSKVDEVVKVINP
ncbi:hypothetical protein NRA16_17765 [Acinetobacter baumannii]|nr:hypothetical protein [Acinetobacter baumannii]